MTIAPDTVLFANGAQRVTAGDLLQTLRDLGVRPGDLLFLHTDLLRFGRPAPELMRVRGALFDALIAVLRETIGPQGTLMMLTLSTRTLDTGRFDVERTPGEAGALTEHFRQLPGVRRIPHPTHSAAVEGPKTDLFIRPPVHPFGAGSLFDLLKREGGKLLFLGADFHWCTFNHHIETMLPVRYRREERVPMTIVRDGAEERGEAIRFRKPARYWTSFARFRTALLERGILRERTLGRAVVSVSDAMAQFELGTEMLRRDHRFFMNVQPWSRFMLFKAKERAGRLLRALGLRR
ncbi:MAG: AAC(3) family N-acetyltransferase [Flavobacteriales bacterium]|jgi:aminoglycoside 3-N-acetyltransferase|nr:AAC(3) family N-acetyltransferase [Flavobacteriales bacterium]MBK7941813.1 AAC(3) family N-acetyltransferase [Flavobacteriales bacterium]MBK8947621.1 AAC(3) family N-acetyltransferase [Flavobacteriales bacterium]MBK9700356.1 AAC(3) family N-acetyltransferase [Flavobacteriales bacterium]